MAERTRVVILGGGFGGIGVTRALCQSEAAADLQITLVDRNNFLLFTPMLPEVAGGTVDPSAIAVATRSMLPGVRFLQGDVQSIDPTSLTATVCIGGGDVPETTETLRADHLVIALGSTTNFHQIPGLEERAVTVKTIEDAQSIRHHALNLLERANVEHDRAQRRKLLTFVVGGGGFSGVETMAALNDLLRDTCLHYEHITPSDIRTVLVHAGPRILPEITERLATYAQRELQRRGVELMLQTDIDAVHEDRVETRNGDTRGTIDSHLVIWAGGVRPSPVVHSSGLSLGHHGGIVVDSCCMVAGHPHIWALGDCAEVPKPSRSDGETYAPTAQNAEREGARVAHNILALLAGREPSPFDYHPIGQLAVVGKRAAVASVYGIHVAGLLAWVMWRAIYLAKLPTVAKRCRVGMDWIIDAFTARDIADLPGVSSRQEQ